MNRTARLLRLLLPGTNPLARGSDRLQGALLTVVFVLATVLVPVMLTFGSLTYSGLVDDAERRSRDWTRATAVVTEDVPPAGYAARGEPGFATTHAAVEWRLPDGTSGTGRASVERGTHAGARVTIWLDEQGKLVGPPSEPADAAFAGVLVAVTGWFVAGGLLALLYYGAKRLLDRSRARSWEQEWTRVEPEWRNQPR
ncbi:hypothetical protein [Actinophytocola sp. NPDC049390]|uniref:Rv1733c family protein n=1 Tax=Actinophytocola sp. NPDC049390 TaxID=3363894 RepID=UPI0037A84AA7